MISTVPGNVRPLLRRLVRMMVFPAVERGWELGFMLAGRLLRPTAERSMPSGSERVLVIAPHPDDETLGCGGTIAHHVEAQDHVCVLIVTDGGSSRAGGRGRDEIRGLRESEATAAMRALGPVDLVQLRLPEGRWKPGDLQRSLEGLLQQDQPTLIYAPSCVDFHPEHVKVARVLARTLRPLEGVANLMVRVYELQVPLTPALANIAVEVGGSAGAKKARAMAEYRTQLSSLQRSSRHSRYLRRLYRSRVLVEVFWELDAGSYCRLMTLCGWAERKYMGMRLRPFGDGLAWVAGLRERLRLKKLVRG
jgi:LmbE family N-acetylglucosaminyl deacetylase